MIGGQYRAFLPDRRTIGFACRRRFLDLPTQNPILVLEDDAVRDQYAFAACQGFSKQSLNAGELEQLICAGEKDLANPGLGFSPMRGDAEIESVGDLGSLGGQRRLLSGMIWFRPDAIEAEVEKGIGPAVIRPADLGDVEIGSPVVRRGPADNARPRTPF